MLFETLMFALTIMAFIDKIKRQFVRHSIVDVFVRDGMWAFSIIFGESQVSFS